VVQAALASATARWLMSSAKFSWAAAVHLKITDLKSANINTAQTNAPERDAVLVPT
jgi:hypothetical protein